MMTERRSARRRATMALLRRFSALRCFFIALSMSAWRSLLADLDGLATVGLPSFVGGAQRWSWTAGSLRSRRAEPQIGAVVGVSEPEWCSSHPWAKASDGDQARPACGPCQRDLVGGRRRGRASPGPRASASTSSAAATGAAERRRGRPARRAPRAPRPRGRRSRRGRRPRRAPAPPAPGPSSSAASTRSARPRTTAKGRPPSLPWASSARPAISSATAGAVTASSLPWASWRPAKSSATTSPAAPTAMSVWPSRQARPAVSVTTTPDVAPGALLQGVAQAPGGGVGVERQQHRRCRGRRWSRRCRRRPASGRGGCARSSSARGGRPRARSRRPGGPRAVRAPPGPRPC